jgi:hypothetical protein
VISTVAEFLHALKEEEARRLAEVDIDHAPTIGQMYEGLSKDLLGRAIPPQLGLRVVSGFITDGLGRRSGQIDCMLVSGDGDPVPYTGKQHREADALATAAPARPVATCWPPARQRCAVYPRGAHRLSTLGSIPADRVCDNSGASGEASSRFRARLEPSCLVRPGHRAGE